MCALPKMALKCITLEKTMLTFEKSVPMIIKILSLQDEQKLKLWDQETKTLEEAEMGLCCPSLAVKHNVHFCTIETDIISMYPKVVFARCAFSSCAPTHGKKER